MRLSHRTTDDAKEEELSRARSESRQKAMQRERARSSSPLLNPAVTVPVAGILPSVDPAPLLLTSPVAEDNMYANGLVAADPFASTPATPPRSGLGGEASDGGKGLAHSNSWVSSEY